MRSLGPTLMTSRRPSYGPPAACTTRVLESLTSSDSRPVGSHSVRNTDGCAPTSTGRR